MEMKDFEMTEESAYELRWRALIQRLVDARAYSLRSDIEIQHVINLLALIEREIPITTPQDVDEENSKSE